MNANRKLAEISPLTFGRISRILFGITTFIVIAILEPDVLGNVGILILVGLGVSFVIGGLFAIPGCEITAIPNLFLPKSMRFHFP